MSTGAGFTVERPGQLKPAIKDALAANRPAVIDIAVDPDALIMPPKIKLSQAVHFGLAKVRETLRLTGC